MRISWHSRAKQAKRARRALCAAIVLSLGAGLAPVSSVAPAVLVAPARAEIAPAALDLAAYKGRVVYLDFWASWCGPCKLSFAYMNQLRARYTDKDLVIVTVNLDRNRAAAAGFLYSVGTHLPVIYDPEGHIAAHHGVATMPTTLLIDRTGKQRFVHRGYFPNKTDEYGAHVAALVAEHS